jgi:hypothetical protein
LFDPSIIILAAVLRVEAVELCIAEQCM